MDVPEVTCGSDQIVNYGAAQLVQLSASATNSPTSYTWTILSAPSGSTAFTETRGNFVNGVATVQNPQFITDANIEGTYVIQCVATNATGDSSPTEDKEDGQQNVVVKTEVLSLYLPNDYQWRWGDYNTDNLLALEDATVAPDAITDIGGPTVLTFNGISDGEFLRRNGSIIEGTTVTTTDEKLKVSASDTTEEYLDDKLNPQNGISSSTVDKGAGVLEIQISPQYGSSANTICQGNDSRLSDARTPTSHATSHQSGGGDSIKLDDLAAPDDNTDLDASTSKHGLLKKLGGGTTNFLRADGSWAAPIGDPSPLTTKGDVYAYDTVNARLSVGTSGQILSAEPSVAIGLKWIDDPYTGAPLTTKGDLYVYDTDDTRLPVGSSGQVIRANPGTSTGLEWVDNVSAESHAALHEDGGSDVITHDNLSGAGTNTHAQIDTHLSNTSNPHSTDIGNLGSGTLAELNSAVSNATLDDSGDSRDPNSHVSSHQSGGSDEINHAHIVGSGTNTHAQIDTHLSNTSNPHSTDIGNLGSGTLAELNSAVSNATLDDSGDSRTPTSHATSHQSGGSDEINHAHIVGSGTNTHAQIDTHLSNTSNPHSTDIGNLGSGTLAELNSIVSNATLDDSGDSRDPNAHATSHQSGGGDSIKLDDLTAPDDNTDLDASTSKHGLLKKLGGGTTNFFRADGSWENPSPLNTKGDIFTYDSESARLPVGASGQVLRSNPSISTGLEWITLSLNEAYNKGNSITISGNPVTLTKTQTDDDQESLEITHDFNSNQGNAVIITSSNTGDGTPVGEEICNISSSVVKNVPEAFYYYALNTTTVRKKVAGGSWETVSVPDTPDDMESIHGSAIDNIWIVGNDAGLGYVAVDSGSGFERVNGHPTFGTHPLDGQTVAESAGINTAVSVFSADDVWTRFMIGTTHYLHQWNGSSWTEKYSIGPTNIAPTVYKAGTTYAISGTGSNKLLYYSLDGGDTWETEDLASLFGSGLSGFVCGGTNESTDRFRLIAYGTFGGTYGYNVIRAYEGLPEGTGPDAWTLKGTYDRGATTNLSPMNYYKTMYADENGETFCLGIGSTYYFIYGFEATPTKIDLGNDYTKAIHGTSASNVAICGNYGFRIWNGSTLSAAESVGIGSVTSLVCLTSAAGAATFTNFKSEMSGSATGSEASALTVGTGHTHAVKATSGDIELVNGTVILGEQALTPDTPTNQGVVYTKQFGETELCYEGTDGNEVQITSSGQIIEHASRHADGGVDELTVQNLGSSAASANQIIETDGSGGWNLVDTPEYSPLTTKGDLYVYDTDDTRLPVGSSGQILSTEPNETTGLKWIDDPYASSPLTTKGDLYVYDTDDTRLPVGSSGQVIRANPGTSTGLEWVDNVSAESHATLHEDGGSDVITHDNLSGAGTNTHVQIDTHLSSTSNPHSTDIGNLGSGTLSGLNLIVSDATLDDSSDSRTPISHVTTHQSGGSDEINHAHIVGSGTNTHAQIDTHLSNTSNPHSTDIGNLGSGTLAELNSIVSNATLDDSGDSRDPNAHATSHQSGGGDSIKLDDLGSPDDNTDLDASTSKHGLLPKLGGGTTNFLRADGSWENPSPLNTKGDIFTYDSESARLPVGASGQVLRSNPSISTGLEWITLSLNEAYNKGNSITISENPVTLTKTQTADDQESLEINHDFNSNQGPAITITCSNSGTGTPNGENIRGLITTIEKRLPSVKYYFAVYSAQVGEKVDAGAWSWSYPPDTPNDLRYIHGSSESDLWICGEDTSNNGYIAHDTGSGFVRDTSHPMNGISAMIWSAIAVSNDEVWTVTYDDSGSPIYRIHKWTSAAGWVEKWSGYTLTRVLQSNIAKTGDHLATGSSDGVVYSNDAGETWAVDKGVPFNEAGTKTCVSVNAATGRFRVTTWKSGQNVLKVYEGFTGGTGDDAWTLINTVGPGHTVEIGTGIWTSENGATFVLSPSYSDFIYDWDNTPIEVNIGNYSNGIFGLSETEVMWADNTIGSGRAFNTWNGASVVTEDFGKSNIRQIYVVEAASGSGTFGPVYKASFTGSGATNESIAFEVGAGATHALKAASGDIELVNGTVILGEQALTPDTPTNQGVVYTKQFGETELCYEGTDGNEVQITSSGQIIEHASRHADGGVDELTVQNLGSSAASANQIIETDGSGGWNLVDTPEYSPLTTKGDLYVYDTDDTRLPVGSSGQILSTEPNETTGLKWIDDPYASSPLTTKGDLYVYDTDDTRLPVGSSGQVIRANPGTSTGLEWVDNVSAESHATLHEDGGSDVITHDNLSGAGTNTHVQIDTHLSSTSNPHSTDIGNLGSGTLSGLNLIVSDATLDDSSDSRTPISHVTTHQSGGSDEINHAHIVGSGTNTHAQIDTHLSSTSNPHSTDIGNLGSGTLSGLNLIVSDATLDDSSDSRTPISHVTTHQSGGSDEINHAHIVGSGTNTHAQIDTHLSNTSNPHSTDIGNLGSGTLSGLNLIVSDATLDDSSDSRTPISHVTTHQSGGSDEIKLDDLGFPDDNTDLNATASGHGLLPKLGGGTTNFLRADGSWENPSPLTTKGDLFTYDSESTRLSVGASGQVLGSNPSISTGLEWITLSLNEAYNKGNSITISGNPVTLTKTQTADDQESLEITHDFNSEQGSIIKITGSNSGDGTPDGETICAIELSLTKKTPGIPYIYIGNDSTGNGLAKQVDGGSWSNKSTNARNIFHTDGVDENTIWIGGQNNSSRAYIGKTDDGGDSWTDDPGTHPLYHTAGLRCHHILVVSSTEVYTLCEHYGIARRSVHRYNGSSWSEILWYQWNFGYPQGGAVAGTTLLYGSTNGMSYATDIYGTPAWTYNDLTHGSSTHCALDPSADQFVIATVTDESDHLKLYRGTPGSWSLIMDTVISGISLFSDNSMGGSCVWVSSSGKIYVTYKVGTDYYLIREDSGSPTTLYSGTYALGFISGASDDLIVLGCQSGTGSVHIWDGSTLTAHTNVISSAVFSAPFVYESLSGTGTSELIQGEFTGSAGSSDAVFIKGGTGLTHVVKSQTGNIELTSGDIELTDGTIILGEQALTPDTPTNQGVVYTKQFGETELCYEGTDGNEVQITSSGQIIEHASRHADGGVDELTVQNLGSSAASANQIIETDGSGGWNLVDTPEYSPLTTKGDLYVYDTANARLSVGSSGQILSTEPNETTGLKWIDDPYTGAPLTTKGDLYVYDTDDTRLPVGSSGQILSTEPNETTGLKWIDDPYTDSPLTTKGDLYVYDTDDTRLPVGSSGQILTVSPSQSTGLEWVSSDTKPFKGIWASTSTINFEEYAGQPTTVRLTLQDGTQRSLDVSTSIVWDETNGVIDLGYDEADSQGNDKWKYFYAVPASGDNASLSIRCSDNPPSTGPAGYNNWKYIWAAYDDDGDLIKVHQQGNKFKYVAERNPSTISGLSVQPVASGLLNPGAEFDISDAVPVSAGCITARIFVQKHNAGSDSQVLELFVKGDTDTTTSGQIRATSSYLELITSTADWDINTMEVEIPTPASEGVPKKIGLRASSDGTFSQWDVGFRVLGWVDEWISST